MSTGYSEPFQRAEVSRICKVWMAFGEVAGAVKAAAVRDTYAA